MDLGLDGKVAIVAASSRGIGKATAKRLSEEGATVSLCARGQDDLEEAVDQCPGPAMGVEADVTKSDDVKRFIEESVEAFGRLDIVVNNAGGPPPGGFSDLESDDFREALDLNLLSTVDITKTALPHLKKVDWGRIINITSVSAKQPIEDLVLSNTARAGVLGAAKTLSNEIAQENITVNSVLPGLTGTDRMEELTEEMANQTDMSIEEAKNETVQEVPMKRWAEPGEIADVIVFLASKRASFVTGTAVQVDGGFINGLI